MPKSNKSGSDKLKNNKLKSDMLKSDDIRFLWKRYAPGYWWGDPLDVRFHLCKELNGISGEKILDVGCNVGIILNSADDSNIKEGFDLDKNAIDIAKMINSRYGLKARFYTKDVFKSNLKKESYDILILAAVLPGFDYGAKKYSFSDCKKFISQCSSYLKVGGILYLTTPNGQSSYYGKKHKATMQQLKELLKDKYEYRIEYWNPFPIYLGHILRYIPGWLSFLNFLMKRNVGKEHCLSFYIKAIKK